MSKPETPCLPECGCVCGHDNDWHALAAGACRSREICACLKFVSRACAPTCPNAPKAEAPPALKTGYWLLFSGMEWQSVTKAAFIAAERAYGFHSKFGPNEVATSSFCGDGIEGRTFWTSDMAPAPPAPKRVSMAQARETLMGQACGLEPRGDGVLGESCREKNNAPRRKPGGRGHSAEFLSQVRDALVSGESRRSIARRLGMSKANPGPITARDLAERLGLKLENGVAPRLSELVRYGWLVKSKELTKAGAVSVHTYRRKQ